MNTIPTISIGIPAYNEAKNITRLLLSLLAQNQDTVRVKEIFVMSDGSSDDTDRKVKAIKDARIMLVNDKKRLGKSARLDEVLKKFSGDALIFIDADVTIRDKHLLTRVIKSANLPKTGLAGVNALPLEATTRVERYIETGVAIMKSAAALWRNGDNYLSYKGCFLALDKKFAKAIRMPEAVINNDAYFYFAAKKKGYTPIYLSDCKVYYRSPRTVADHGKQAARFQTSRGEMAKYFKRDWDSEYVLPKHIIAIALLRSIMKKPLQTVGYLRLNLAVRLLANEPINSTWSIAKSTK